MDTSPSTSNRRAFLKSGAAAGSLAGLGLNLQAARASVGPLRSRLKGAKEYASVCPYCAVGCGQIVSVRDGKIVNIEGNPDSPISAGTLCPKGSATFQLAVNENRLTKVKYRAPFSKEWVEKDLDWAMDQIALRIKDTRDGNWTETWNGIDSTGKAHAAKVNHCSTIASLGGATMDNEWNYVHLKAWRALGLIWLENQARI